MSSPSSAPSKRATVRFLPSALFFTLALGCLHPAISSATGLILGLIFGLFVAHPYLEFNKQWIHRLLSWSIIGLGAGMNLTVLAKVGLSGIAYTLTGIALTLGFGLLLGRWTKTQEGLSILICSGTAICGGSAIAAVSTTLRSKAADVSTALIVVFLLNSLALLIFPPLGHWLGLTEPQFGLWSALAIHDTSSVVGASIQYGPEAVQIGTLVKLARALWIIPLTIFMGSIYKNRDASEAAGKIKRPWFILGFVIAAAVVTWIPALQPTGQLIASGAKRLFVVTLFLIGSGFNRANLKALSVRPLIQAVTLWVVVSVVTLLAIERGWIQAHF